MKVYLSGGMRSGWGEIVRAVLPDVTFLNPAHHALKRPSEYTLWDMVAIESCDVVLAYLEKDNPSGLGLAFEIGYARGLRKPVLFVNEKLDDKYTRILEQGATLNFPSDLESAIRFLDRMAKAFG